MTIEHGPLGRISTTPFCAYSGEHGGEPCDNEATAIVGCAQARGITFALMACPEHEEAVRTFLQRVERRIHNARFN